jgi:glucose/arabinose dehydrogenase
MLPHLTRSRRDATRSAVLGGLLLAAAGCLAADALPLESIRLPDGFKIEIFAADVPNARQMAWSPARILYVGSREAGTVYALPDTDGEWRADAVHVLARGLKEPSGVAYRDGALYVADVDRVLRYDDIDRRFADSSQRAPEPSPAPAVVSDAFPGDRHHGWKFIAFGPDGRLYVPVGAPCNVCEVSGLHATITRIAPGGGTPEIVARGVRNTVGFDWHPESGELWFTDNGRDRLGDDVPPDELNRLASAGQHFGFPFCHGGDLADPELGRRASCAEFVPPAQKLGAHVAAIGMRFYDAEQFPAAYRGAIFIAEHGSWNRSEKIGYRVTVVRLEGDRAVAYEPFAEGWLDGQRAWGRPADVEIAPDGSLLVSDDHAGAIYRISYTPTHE